MESFLINKLNRIIGKNIRSKVVIGLLLIRDSLNKYINGFKNDNFLIMVLGELFSPLNNKITIRNKSAIINNLAIFFFIINLFSFHILAIYEKKRGISLLFPGIAKHPYYYNDTHAKQRGRPLYSSITKIGDFGNTLKRTLL